jgi:DNA-binding NtrC family response regulator
MAKILEISDTVYTGRQSALVVDDEPNVLVTVGAFLRRAGFAVATTGDSGEAMRLIADDPCIDVLITDFTMPGICGTELISEAKQLRPTLKALVMTGYPGAIAELPPGASMIVKPFRRVELIDAVQSLLAEPEKVAN